MHNEIKMESADSFSPTNPDFALFEQEKSERHDLGKFHYTNS